MSRALPCVAEWRRAFSPRRLPFVASHPALLHSHHTMSRQRLGQHFLHDLGWRKRILATLPLAANQTWIEIGPGHGEITQLLVGDNRRIIAIETDQRLAEGLRASRDTEPTQWPGLEVITADVLATNIGDLAAGEIHVYGNLPYYITSPILHHLFRGSSRIASTHIVIQL